MSCGDLTKEEAWALQMDAASDRCADELLGTCQDIGEEFQEFTLDAEFCAGLDNRVGCCSGCGWWVEAGELNDAYECEDCAGEEDE